MKLDHMRKAVWGLVLLGWCLCFPGGVSAIEAEKEEPSQEIVHLNDVVRIGDGAVVRTNEVAQDVVVVMGAVMLDGKSEGDVINVLGGATINGVVHGDVICVMGPLKLGPDAEIKGDVMVLGGKADISPSAKVHGELNSISLGPINWNFNWLSEWFARGLCYARPLPPTVGWVWVFTAVMALVYVFLSLLFPRPMQACVRSLDDRPMASLLAGMLGMLLVGPVVLLLIVSVAGILVVPFLFCGMVMTLLFGKVAVYQYAGLQLGRQCGVGILQKPIISLLVGLVFFCLLYMVPVLGFVMWSLVIPMGIGSVLMAIGGSFKRETMPSQQTGNAPPPETSVPPAIATGATQATEPASPTVPPIVSSLSSLELASLPRASFWQRTAATVLDLVLVCMLTHVAHLALMPPLLWVLYHIVMWTWKGTTVGGIVVGLKVVRQNGAPITWQVATVRCLAAFLSAAALGFGFFWVAWSRERLAWHDIIAGTMIVKVPKSVPLVVL